MAEDATRAWLILAAAPGLDGNRLAGLLAGCGGAVQLLRAGASHWRAAGLPPNTIAALGAPDEARIAAARAWLGAAADHHLIGVDDPRFPPLLRQASDPPVALFVRGDPATLSVPQLAIVGSRNASPAGMETAHAFARHIAGLGLGITSGLALGIDTAAHRGALAADGLTVAVLGTGPDRIYPARNAALGEEIARCGALCSEFLPGTPPLRENFPQRNRIISALAAGTLVVEAGLQSGALITARRAVEQGREVFAIPGSIHNPLAKGCHQLIRSGAKLVESAEHILEELAPLLAAAPQAQTRPGTATAVADDARLRDPDYRRLLEALGWDTTDADTLALRSGLTSAEVSSMLLILELEGLVQPLAGGRYQRQR
ncbi:MAG: DNA-processing protein DprA [Gammaproteobacteria bacterium]|nr:MAG: DNA-processing protein DprA [Gammaproteobacteria bacterium]